MTGSERLGHLDALIGVGRRHPDIGQNRIGFLLFDRREERVGVNAESNYFDVGGVREDVLERLTNEVLIFPNDHPNTFDRHLHTPGAILGYRRPQAPVIT